MSESFAEKLRKIRTAKNITQQQLASIMYVDRSSIARWENGSRIPDLILLQRLARCLNVDTSVFFPDEMPEQLSVIILDDEPLILNGELKVLSGILPTAEIIGFTKPSEAIEYAKGRQINIAFVDIEMGKTNGFDVCQELNTINPSINVIFLTAYPDYSLKAWETEHAVFWSSRCIRKTSSTSFTSCIIR